MDAKTYGLPPTQKGPSQAILCSKRKTKRWMICPLLKLGWIVCHFEAHSKYLQLADKASRTVAVLTERLDQRRGRGQQQTTVKHVTVNADQAVVTDQIVSREAKEGGTAALLTIGKPIEILEPTHGRSCHRLGVQFQWGRGQLYSRSAPFYHCRPVIQSRNFSRVV